MKLALVADAFDLTNGWGRYAGELARGLIQRGVDLRLVSPRRYCRLDDLRDYPDFCDIPSFQHQTRHYAKLLARTFIPLRRALRDVDAVHCMVEPYAPSVGLAAGGRPYAVSLVGTYAVPSRRPPVEAWLLRRALRRARVLTAISAHTESKVRADTGLEHTAVVPLGVDAGEFTVADPPLREPRLIVSVGEVKPRKGVDLVVEAVAGLRAELPGLRYAIVGPYRDASPFVQKLRRRIRALRLTDAVTMTGSVSHNDLVDWYHRAAVVAMPFRADGADFEGFGLVLLEAGAAGAPVIGARESAAEETVQDARNGLLVPPGDVTALANAIRCVLTDTALADRLSAGGHARAAEMSWDRSTERMLDVYARAFGRRVESRARP